MSSLELLKQIEALLSSEEVDCALIEATENENPRLLVYLDNDYKKRERILEIMGEEQFFSGLPNMPAQESERFARLQFQVKLPFGVEDKAVADTASLLILMNRFLELPGWEMNELENQLFFRHVLLTSNPEGNKALYISVLGLILMTLDFFTETVETVASGQATFNDVLQQMIDITKNQE